MADTRKPALIDYKPSPSFTALTSIIAFQNAINTEYGAYFSDEEKKLVDEMVRIAIANEPNYFRWLHEQGLKYSPYRLQQKVLAFEFAHGYVQQKLARKLMIRELIAQRILNENLEQVVFLGGGYDTRGFMLSEEYFSAELQIFEVDVDPTREIKLEALTRKKRPDYPDHIILNGNYHLLKCNLSSDDLCAILLAAGFDPAKRTLFVGEGVSMYLSKEDNIRLLNTLVTLSNPKSEVLLSYRSSTQNQALGAALQSSSNESYKFALPPGQVMDFAFDCGLSVVKKEFYAEMLDWVAKGVRDTVAAIAKKDEAGREHYYLLEPISLLKTYHGEIEDLSRITDDLIKVKPERQSICALL